MAARLNFYVYRIFDGAQTLYVGKGSGKRLADQKRRFRCEGEIIEECNSDDHAFKREIHWIAELRPTENRAAGGNGGRCRPKRAPSIPREIREIERIGTRRYAAMILVRKLDESNCEQWGVSLGSLAKIREVAAA